MPLDLISLVNWLKLNDKEINEFFSECLKNNVSIKDRPCKRFINDLKDIDIQFVFKAYNSTSKSKVEEIRSSVKADYISKIFSLKYIDWYMVRPLGKNGTDPYRILFPLYLPNTEVFDQVKQYLIDFREPCFDFDYISLTDMTDGKETVLFLGSMNESEPKCLSDFEHKWNWSVYREDFKEIYFAKCERCGIEKEALIGDIRDYKWNENHGWRYLKNDE